MKKVISRKRYDTDTSTEIGSWNNQEKTIQKSLYKKRTGEYFLFLHGGPSTVYASKTGPDQWADGWEIEPLSYADARAWAERFLSPEQYHAEFGIISQNQSHITVSISLCASTLELAKREAAKRSMNLSTYIERLIQYGSKIKGGIPMTTHIMIELFHAERGKLPDTEHTSFAGVSYLSTRQEGVTVQDRLPASCGDGWNFYGGTRNMGVAYRKMVEIELPDGVEDGPFRFANNRMLGLHSSKYRARDGMGPCVYCYCGESAQTSQDEDWSDTIDRAIRSGIFLSVPNAEGKRDQVRVKVLRISPIYGDNLPEDGWTEIE